MRMGGGMNHRIGLYDAALVKDNHIEATGSIAEAVKAVRRHAPFMAKVEVEGGNLKQVQEAIDAGADVIMLDNMTLAQMAEAVKLVKKRAWVEASGGITLETIRKVAATGVDFISSGALTHSAPVVDFNMKITMNVDKVIRFIPATACAAPLDVKAFTNIGAQATWHQVSLFRRDRFDQYSRPSARRKRRERRRVRYRRGANSRTRPSRPALGVAAIRQSLFFGHSPP